MARMILANGESHPVTPKGKKFTLDELQALVGGYIQVLDLIVTQSSGKRLRVRMVIDEEGKLRGKPVNDEATKLVAPSLWSGDYVVGDAILLEKGDVI